MKCYLILWNVCYHLHPITYKEWSLALFQTYQLKENRPVIINNTLLYCFKPSNNLSVHHAQCLNLLTLVLIMYKTLTVLQHLLLMLVCQKTSLFHSRLMLITVKSEHFRIVYNVELNNLQYRFIITNHSKAFVLHCPLNILLYIS